MALTIGPRPEITRAIDDARVADSEGPRPHMGASLLGHPCERYLWLSFRWAIKEDFSGRQLRLFDRGKREEKVFVRALRRIGVNVTNTDSDPRGEQIHVELAPHVGGSLDGIIQSGLPDAPKEKHIVEFKTHNEKSFKELEKLGVYEAKRRHWCQMQCYMKGTGINYALYMAVNKNDDSLYCERVAFNADVANMIIARGARIALAERMPAALSNDPTFYKCKMCSYWAFCHKSHLSTEINCRTCSHVTPRPDGSWHCEYFDSCVGYDDQLGPCDFHVFHPDLVPWHFLGGRLDGRAAGYEIDGKEIINGGVDGATRSIDILSHRNGPQDEVYIPF